MNKKRIAILGSTGSVGKNTVEVIERYPDVFQVTAVTAHSHIEDLLEQAKRLKPEFVGLTGPADYHALQERLGDIRLGMGQEALLEACDTADLVVLAVVGIAGLPAFLYCLKKGIPVALANKESLVCGGRIARQLMEETGTPVLPVDSESYAIFQCLEGAKREDVASVYLTASGGPFRTSSLEEMKRATVKDALKHPNWDMGAKISIDSATMFNKGLEIMETRWLFDIPAERIHVVVHPESVVHSLVEFKDNSLLAQMGVSDMKLPIAGALAYPKKLNQSVRPLDLYELGSVHFEKPDLERFPCLALAYEAVRSENSLQIVLNAANEVAVAWFLAGAIGFLDIAKVLEKAMKKFGGYVISNENEIYEIDKEVRAFLHAQ